MQEFTHYVLPVILLTIIFFLGFFFGRRGTSEIAYEKGREFGYKEGREKSLQDTARVQMKDAATFVAGLMPFARVSIQFLGNIENGQTALYLMRTYDSSGYLMCAEITRHDYSKVKKGPGGKFPFINGTFIKKGAGANYTLDPADQQKKGHPLKPSDPRQGRQGGY